MTPPRSAAITSPVSIHGTGRPRTPYPVVAGIIPRCPDCGTTFVKVIHTDTERDEAGEADKIERRIKCQKCGRVFLQIAD